MAIPEEHVWYITPRSGMASQHLLTVFNASDAGYWGEIEVLLVNHRHEVVEIKVGRASLFVIHSIIAPRSSRWTPCPPPSAARKSLAPQGPS